MTDLADRWLAQDREGARDRQEAEAMLSSLAVRAWIVERWLEAGASPDALSGFAQLGRVLAEDGVSCASALATVTSFARLAPRPDPRGLEAARSALADAFVEARLEHERRLGRARFEDCWLEVAAGVGAIAASPPTDDAEWLQEWADGVTRALLRRQVRRCHVRAPELARAALDSALVSVGIEPIETAADGAQIRAARGPEPRTRWRRLLGF